MELDEIKFQENQLKVFRNINGENKKYWNKHTNVILSNNESDAIRNQGIARAKLREFVKEHDVNYEYWCK